MNAVLTEEPQSLFSPFHRKSASVTLLPETAPETTGKAKSLITHIHVGAMKLHHTMIAKLLKAPSIIFKAKSRLFTVYYNTTFLVHSAMIRGMFHSHHLTPTAFLGKEPIVVDARTCL